MKVLLAPVTGDATDGTVLDAAFAVARQFQSHIKALYIAPDPKAMLPFIGEGVPPSFIEQWQATAEREIAAARTRARDRFDAWRQSHRIPLASRPDRRNDVSVEWIEQIGSDEAIITSAGRAADLVLLARPVSSEDVRGRIVAESALFATGRPTLVVPRNTKIDLHGHAVIAWNGSREAARALSAALPLLRLARAVEMVAIAEVDKNGLEAEAAQEFLAWHEIKATVTRRKQQGSAAETLVDLVRGANAHLLIMGAYTHTRVREMVFGGVTQHVLTRADVPALMCH